MKNYLSYDNTGAITSWGEIDDLLNLPVIENSTSIEVPTIPNPNVEYWSNGLQPRPELGCVISALTVPLGTNITITNLPADIVVSAYNLLFPTYGVIVPVVSNTATLEFSHVGHYQLNLTLFPYQSKTYNLEVTIP